MWPTFFNPADNARRDEASAFPASLGPFVHEAAAAGARGESHPPGGSFSINLDHETLSIPYRVYYDAATLRREIRRSQGVRKMILACLGTRHHDGYLRHECLAEILKSDEAWVNPFILQLAGEYVVEIARDVAAGVIRRDVEKLASYAKENSAYLATLQRRVTSYWSCYHRAAYPDRHAYPGTKVVAYLRQIVE